VQQLVRIILPSFNKLSYLQIILRIMNKKTSVILTATMATVLTLSLLAVAIPAPVLGGIAGVAGAPGEWCNADLNRLVFVLNEVHQ
jgi:hypothetical protein